MTLWLYFFIFGGNKERENRIDGVIVSKFVLSAVDHTKDCLICMCCFSAKHTALRRKSKNWLALSQDNVSEWKHVSIHRLLFQ